ncbi:MAG: hypothetical protein FWB72_04075 [Firmicutes bacterium]|nr:hypothetical protein [Bacillota bacterium]
MKTQNEFYQKLIELAADTVLKIEEYSEKVLGKKEMELIAVNTKLMESFMRQENFLEPMRREMYYASAYVEVAEALFGKSEEEFYMDMLEYIQSHTAQLGIGG